MNPIVLVVYIAAVVFPPLAARVQGADETNLYSDVIPMSPSRAPDGSEFKQHKTIKIRVRYARAAEIADQLGGSIVDYSHGRENARLTTGSFGSSGSMANLLPPDIQLIAFVPDNTLIVSFENEDSLRELLPLVRGLDVRPRMYGITAEAEIDFTDSAGRRKPLRFSGRGAVMSDHRLHLTNKCEEGSIKLTSDCDLTARAQADGSIHLGADWYVDVAVAAGGKNAVSRAHNIYRTDAVGKLGQTVAVTTASLSLAGGKVDLVLKLTPRLVDPGAVNDGRPLPGGRR